MGSPWKVLDGEVICSDKPSKKGDKETRNRNLEKPGEGSVGGGYLRVYIQKQTVSKHQIRQNLRYKIQKTEKVRKSLEGDKVCDYLLLPLPPPLLHFNWGHGYKFKHWFSGQDRHFGQRGLLFMMPIEFHRGHKGNTCLI